jgi:hypothetical protein
MEQVNPWVLWVEIPGFLNWNLIAQIDYLECLSTCSHGRLGCQPDG